jgi:hypothetical protein
MIHQAIAAEAVPPTSQRRCGACRPGIVASDAQSKTYRRVALAS